MLKFSYDVSKKFGDEKLQNFESVTIFKLQNILINRYTER